MKRERRHELEQNELADWLAKLFERTKPYQTAILAVVILVAVAVGGYLWWSRQSAQRTTAGWDQFYRAQQSHDPADFEAVLEDYPDADAARWARAMAADLRLAIGCDALFEDKSFAKQQLREAVDHYLRLLEDDHCGPMLRQRATFGLARARESQGDLQKAIEHYRQLTENWPEGPFADQAARRLKDLNRPDTKKLYDRFAKFDPKPSYAEEPGLPGDLPEFGDPNALPPDPPADGSLFAPRLKLGQEGAEPGKPQDAPKTPAGPGPDDSEPPGTGPTGEESPAGEPTGEQPAPGEASAEEATGEEPTGAGPTDSSEPNTQASGSAETQTTETTEADTERPDPPKAGAEGPEPADAPETPAQQGK